MVSLLLSRQRHKGRLAPEIPNPSIDIDAEELAFFLLELFIRNSALVSEDSVKLQKHYYRYEVDRILGSPVPGGEPRNSLR